MLPCTLRFTSRVATQARLTARAFSAAPIVAQRPGKQTRYPGKATEEASGEKGALRVVRNPRLSKDEEALPALTTFAARLHLNHFSDPKILLQALTHKSYDHARVPTNERLEFLGRRVVSLLVGEHLHAKYPTLPVNTLRDALDTYASVATLGRIGKELGVGSVMRWVPAIPDDGNVDSTINNGESKVIGIVMLSIIGALYHDKGAKAAKTFIEAHILGRKVDVESLLVLDQPKRTLTALMQRKGMDRPISRLISETGRRSNSPVYLVGVYSGSKLLGTGYGSSMRMAEHRAAKETISKYYLAECQDLTIGSDIPAEREVDWAGPKLGDTQVVL